MLRKTFFLSALFSLLCGFMLQATASTVRCNACGMDIAEESRNHFLLSFLDTSKPAHHVCSLACLKKIQTYNSNYSKIEISDFNSPKKFLNADEAFFLMKSEKIKKTLG